MLRMAPQREGPTRVSNDNNKLLQKPTAEKTIDASSPSTKSSLPNSSKEKATPWEGLE